MSSFVFIGPAVVLLYALGLTTVAFQVKRKARPFEIRWARLRFRWANTLKESLWLCVVILAANAVLFVVPAFVGADRHGAALDGIVDIVCGLTIYGLHRWSKQLLLEIANNTQM